MVAISILTMVEPTYNWGGGTTLHQAVSSFVHDPWCWSRGRHGSCWPGIGKSSQTACVHKGAAKFLLCLIFTTFSEVPSVMDHMYRWDEYIEGQQEMKDSIEIRWFIMSMKPINTNCRPLIGDIGGADRKLLRQQTHFFCDCPIFQWIVLPTSCGPVS